MPQMPLSVFRKDAWRRLLLGIGISVVEGCAPSGNEITTSNRCERKILVRVDYESPSEGGPYFRRLSPRQTEIMRWATHLCSVRGRYPSVIRSDACRTKDFLYRVRRSAFRRRDISGRRRSSLRATTACDRFARMMVFAGGRNNSLPVVAQTIRRALSGRI